MKQGFKVLSGTQERFILFLMAALAFFLMHHPAELSAEQDAAPKDQIIWGIRHFPPLYILEGDYRGKGMVDQMLDLLIRNLPEYRHEKKIFNNSMVEEELRKGSHVARIAFFKKPEREEYMYYSIPHYISPSHRLIIRRDAFPKIQRLVSGVEEDVSLDSVLKTGNIRIGMERGRSLGESIDRIVKAYEGQRNISETLSPNTEKLVDMLTMKKVDCIIEYPAVVTFILKKEQEKINMLRSVRIREAVPYEIAYAVAPKNEWGYTLIQKINAIFRKEIPTEEYRNFTEQWLDESNIRQFRDEYQKRLVDALQETPGAK